jgi:hypothetical protein
MTLLDLINSQKKNTERYNFIIYFKGVDIIRTTVKIKFIQLISIIGLSLEYMKIEYTINRSNVVMIEIKG